MELLKKLFGSRKWVLALVAIIADIVVLLKLPPEQAVNIATFITVTAGIIIGSEAIIDTFGPEK